MNFGQLFHSLKLHRKIISFKGRRQEICKLSSCFYENSRPTFENMNCNDELKDEHRTKGKNYSITVKKKVRKAAVINQKQMTNDH